MMFSCAEIINVYSRGATRKPELCICITNRSRFFLLNAFQGNCSRSECVSTLKWYEENSLLPQEAFWRDLPGCAMTCFHQRGRQYPFVAASRLEKRSERFSNYNNKKQTIKGFCLVWRPLVRRVRPAGDPEMKNSVSGRARFVSACRFF